MGLVVVRWIPLGGISCCKVDTFGGLVVVRWIPLGGVSCCKVDTFGWD